MQASEDTGVFSCSKPFFHSPKRPLCLLRRFVGFQGDWDSGLYIVQFLQSCSGGSSKSAPAHPVFVYPGLCLSGSGKSVDLIYSIINGYCSIFSVFGSRKFFLGRVVLSPLGRFCRPQKTQGSFLAQNPFSFAEKTPVSSSVFCRFSRGLGFRSLHSSISAKLFRRLLKIRPCPSGLCLSCALNVYFRSSEAAVSHIWLALRGAETISQPRKGLAVGNRRIENGFEPRPHCLVLAGLNTV